MNITQWGCFRLTKPCLFDNNLTVCWLIDRVCLSPNDKYNLYQIQCKTMSWETIGKRQIKALHFKGFYKNVEKWRLFPLWDRYQMILDLFFWQSPERHRQILSINMFTFIPLAEAFILFSCEVNVCCQTLSPHLNLGFSLVTTATSSSVLLKSMESTEDKHEIAI